MRIAFVGSHRVGKSTLLATIAELLPGYTTVDEPYYLLEEEGYQSSEPPSLEDFEAQLERSLLAIEHSEANTLFDRCPADILAYLLVHDDASAFDGDAWSERTREIMSMLDLIIFVPVESPDRIPLPAHEDRRQRRAVHDKLHELLLEGALEIEAGVVRVQGSTRERVEQIRARIEALRDQT